MFKHIITKHWRAILVISVLYWSLWKIIGIFSRWDLILTPAFVTFGFYIGHLAVFRLIHRDGRHEEFDEYGHYRDRR